MIRWLTLGALASAYLLPLILLINLSLQPEHAHAAGQFFTPPKWVTLAAWREAWNGTCVGSECTGMSRWVVNSLVITIPATTLTLLVGMATGFALTFRILAAKVVLGLLVLGLFIPPQVVLYPMIIVLRGMNLFGTTTGLVLAHIVWGLPFTALLFRRFFLAMPREIFQMAALDGASFKVSLWYLVLPAALPAIASAAILQFTFVWNDFLLGLTYGDSFTQPVTVALQAIAGSQYEQSKYSVLAAAAIIGTLPTALLYAVGGKMLLRGLPFESNKE